MLEGAGLLPPFFPGPPALFLGGKLSHTYRDHPNATPKHGPRWWNKCRSSSCWLCRTPFTYHRRDNDLRKAIEFDILANEVGLEESTYLARNAKIEEEAIIDEYYNHIRTTE